MVRSQGAVAEYLQPLIQSLILLILFYSILSIHSFIHSTLTKLLFCARPVLRFEETEMNLT